METYYTVKEVAKILGMAEITIRQWMGRGQLKFTKFGTKAVRISKTEVERIINNK
jgi:excisionase family DNA binding protein